MEDLQERTKDFDWKINQTKSAMLEAMLPEVAFEGWSEQAFLDAIRISGVEEPYAKLAFPNGAIDVAIYMHKAGDWEMAEGLATRTATIQSFSAKIETAIIYRLEIAARHKDAVRAAASIFAMPQHSITGSKLIWHTADAIWTALGDQSHGFTHYSKRSSLSAVYSSSFLYWLQDTSPEYQNTKGFVSRRIQDVGKFGKFTGSVKSKFKRNPA